MPPASLSGSLSSVARISNVALPILIRAGLDIEPRQQRGIGDGAEAPFFRRARRRADRRIELDLAVERIGAVDRFDLDQRRVAVSARAIARIVAVTETRPRLFENARSPASPRAGSS